MVRLANQSSLGCAFRLFPGANLLYNLEEDELFLKAEGFSYVDHNGLGYPTAGCVGNNLVPGTFLPKLQLSSLLFHKTCWWVAYVR